VWESGQPSWSVDLISDMNFLRREQAIRCGLRCGAALPVYVGAELYGVMEFISQKVQTPDPKFLEVMADIASRLGYYVQRIETEELIQAKQAAEEANKAKSTFLANMSHEIRTPLGVVLGFSELLMSPETTSEEKAVCMATIKRNCELLSSIINDILDLSKVETGKLDIEIQNVVIEEVLNEISSHLSLKAQEKGVEYRVQTEGDIPRTIRTDPIRLRQILINIIGNAIKFTEKGSVQVTLKQVSPPGSRVRLAFIVKDTGRGISFAQREKLFQPFSQADASTTRKFGGTGLGLILSKRMAGLLGGDVVLSDSQPGQGSTFIVTIESLETASESQELPAEAVL
jgi:signal transduction histidine kinase